MGSYCSAYAVLDQLDLTGFSEGEVIVTKCGGADPSFLKGEFLLTRTPPP
jgi:hypothetical protein